LVFGYAALAQLVVPAPIGPVVIADPDDDEVLACAVAAQAEVMVSGDRALLALESYAGIPIITAAQLMVRIAS
jgi:predicted nucleic acid-binding protein